MSLRLGSALSCHDLPFPELQAARLDGELFAVADCFSPIDEPEDMRHRAHALARSVASRLIAEQLSAAWVLGACAIPPSRHQFCVQRSARIAAFAGGACDVREVVLSRGDTIACAGLRLTTPVRTAIDIARAQTAFGAREHAIVRNLMRIGRFDIAQCISAMDASRNLPGKHRAAQRLLAAAP